MAPKKKDNVQVVEKPVCYKCQAWDIADAVGELDTSAAGRDIIVGTCIRRGPKVVATFNADGDPIMTAAWPITDEDKGCYDIIWKEEHK